MSEQQQVDIAGITDIGQVRQVNEDALLIAKATGVFAVADGMGGHGSGDIASQLALDTLNQHTQQHDSNLNADQDFTQLIHSNIKAVNQTVYDENVSAGHPYGTGMGTTLVGFAQLNDSDKAVSFNIGDSRLYQLHSGKLTQLTTDHTLHEDWLKAGRTGPEPPRNIILRAVGLFADIEVDLESFTLLDNATYLLCSDGLTGMVSDSAMANILADEHATSQQLCEKLVELANAEGGIDNITALIMRRFS